MLLNRNTTRRQNGPPRLPKPSIATPVPIAPGTQLLQPVGIRCTVSCITVKFTIVNEMCNAGPVLFLHNCNETVEKS